MSLLDAAKQVREHAYAPYSNFKVGAAIRTDSGNVYVGCNVENVAYPEGTCAEAGAIAAMVAAGETRITEALVVADSPIAGFALRRMPSETGGVLRGRRHDHDDDAVGRDDNDDDGRVCCRAHFGAGPYGTRVMDARSIIAKTARQDPLVGGRNSDGLPKACRATG